MTRYVVNASTGEFERGEIVELEPELFADLVEGKYLSPIDEWGNRLTEAGDVAVLRPTGADDDTGEHEIPPDYAESAE